MAEKKGLLFTLGHFNLCCPAENMQEVIYLEKNRVREIPGVRSLFRGLFVFHQEIVPLLNLSLLLQLGEENKDIISVGVMALHSGYHFGITIADETEIILYNPNELKALETAPRGIDPQLFAGMISSKGRMIFMIAIENFQRYFFRGK